MKRGRVVLKGFVTCVREKGRRHQGTRQQVDSAGEVKLNCKCEFCLSQISIPSVRLANVWP